LKDHNSFDVVGRLTRDAEIKHIPSGMSITSFSIASNDSVNKNGTYVDEANFFDIQIWGKFGEAMHKHLTKGKQVLIHGRLKQNRWTDAEGNNRSKFVVNAEDIQLFGQSQNSQNTTGSHQHAQHQQEEFEEDIPF